MGMRHRRASVLGDGDFDVRGHGIPNSRAVRHVRAVVSALIPPARLELALLDPQLARASPRGARGVACCLPLPGARIARPRGTDKLPGGRVGFVASLPSPLRWTRSPRAGPAASSTEEGLDSARLDQGGRRARRSTAARCRTTTLASAVIVVGRGERSPSLPPRMRQAALPLSDRCPVASSSLSLSWGLWRTSAVEGIDPTGPIPRREDRPRFLAMEGEPPASPSIIYLITATGSGAAHCRRDRARVRVALARSRPVRVSHFAIPVGRAGGRRCGRVRAAGRMDC